MLAAKKFLYYKWNAGESRARWAASPFPQTQRATAPHRPSLSEKPRGGWVMQERHPVLILFCQSPLLCLKAQVLCCIYSITDTPRFSIHNIQLCEIQLPLILNAVAHCICRRKICNVWMNTCLCHINF